MNRKILNILALAAAVLGFTMCRDEGLPSNAVVQFPIKTLVVTLNNGNDDYTATPKANDDGTLNDTLTINTFKPQPAGRIKTLVLADPGMTANIREGDEVPFVEDRFTIVLTAGSSEHKYCLRILYPKEEGPEDPDPEDYAYVWFAWNSGATEDATSKKVSAGVNPKLISVDSDGKYEGYVDLTGRGWYNIGVVNSALTKFYDHEHDAALPNTTSFTLAMTEKESDNGMFAFGGPWAGWDGMYRADFNGSSKEFTLLKTNWAVSGTATGGTARSLTYDPGTMKWSGEAALSGGAFKFTTVAATAGDPTVTYGDKGGRVLGESGSDITVTEGNYNITLDLTSPPNYKYTITKKNDPVVGDYVSFVTWATPSITASTPKIYDATGSNIYEGHVYLGYETTQGTPMALVNSAKNMVYTCSGWHMIPYEGMTDANYGHPLGYASIDFRTESYPAATATGIPGVCGPAAKWNHAAGVWMIRLDLTGSPAHVFVIQTEWNIKGSATGDEMKAMTYNSSANNWSITANLTAGGFKFTNLAAGKFRNDEAPVEGPESITMTYGRKSGAALEEDGAEITVETDGNYTVLLDLSGTAYTYSVTKN